MKPKGMPQKEWLEISKITNAIYILSDIQESWINDIEKKMKDHGELKFELKHYVSQIKNFTRLMVEKVNKRAPSHNDNFAHDAELLKRIIDKELFN